MAKPAPLSPMFRQYHALKQDHPNAILLFRMGDFYEMFFDDAKVASRLLELTLTARGKGTDNVVPMCGFPHHQVDTYTARLVHADQRVAICDQVEDPKKTKGLVRREVVRVVTPGTTTDPTSLSPKENLWVCAVTRVASRYGAAFADLSTGESLAWETAPDDADAAGSLLQMVRSFAPREVVHPEGLDLADDLRDTSPVLSPIEAFAFDRSAAATLLQRHLGVASLDGFGLRERQAAVAAAGGLLQYLQDTQKSGLEHIVEIALHEPSRFMLLDPATRRNLEIERCHRDGGRRGSVVHAVDRTVTAAGGRLLRRWLLAPLLDPAEIARRQDTVEEFVRDSSMRGDVREHLADVHDIERLLARIVASSAGPRDLTSLRASLERLPDLLERLSDFRSAYLRERMDRMDPCADLATRLRESLADDPPAAVRDGGVIREGHHEELDSLRAIRRDGRAFIAVMETRERERTGIASLKVKYNRVFGYFIEVSRSNLHLVPDDYNRKQTIAGGERYVTPELKEYENKVLNAQERIEELELELFQHLRSAIAAEALRLKAIANALARIDVLTALGDLAARNVYVRPTIDDGNRMRIVGGRHPVVEQSLVDARFVPNDTSLEAAGRAVAIITGPNMGGKSTYLRQVALIALLGQTGSFVPASEVEFGVVDRIFCRVGASDSLAEGQSTFMVEMSETANILRHATPRSLLLLDEIGRGTSTFDGMSIAWAVVEHLDEMTGGPPRTLFATHYHELTELAVERDGVLNLRLGVREWGDSVVFLHRVEEGASDRSYGIQVARLAGVPGPVVERAKEILANLERDEYGKDGHPRRARTQRPPNGGERRSTRQLPLQGLFADPVQPREESEVIDALRNQDPDRLTPLDALRLIVEWKSRLGSDAADRDEP